MKVKALIDYAYEQGEDVSYSLHRFLDYMMKVFDPESLKASNGNKVITMGKALNENPFYFSQMLDWLEEVDAVLEGPIGWIDSFGLMYEEVFKGKAKASLIGQFFTPSHISSLLARLEVKEERHPHICDPACGSGRNLLAHFAASDQSKFQFYFASDIDLVSCKMCALNLMAHGMIGAVICRNAVSDNDFKIGWMINEIRYPLPCDWYSIREITEKEFLNL